MKKINRMFCMLLAMVLLLGSIPMSAFAAGDVMYGIAFVDATSLRLRSKASTSSSIVDTAYDNEVVIVVSKHGDWYKVIYNLQEGYMHEDYLKVSREVNAELGYGKFNGSSVNVRSGAGTSYSRVTKGNTGDKAYIIGIDDGWYKIIFNGKIGYVRSDYLDLTQVPYENKESSNTPKFFRGGKSTGTEPSADALNGSSNNSASNNNSSNPGSTETPKDEEKNESTTTNTSDSGKKYGIAFVTGSGLRLRSEANTNSRTLDSASKKEVVVVLSKHGDWYKVNYDLKIGYMHGDYLDVQTVGNAELGYGRFNASSVNVRSGPGTSHSRVTQGSRGDKAYIIGINDGWYKIIFNGKIGYVRSDYLDLTEAPYENKSSSKSPKFFRGGKSTGVEPSAEALNGGSSGGGSSDSDAGNTGSVTGKQIVAKAEQYLGVPYKWGGTSPSGFDCSGFVYYVLRSQGINASRTLKTMYAQGTKVSKSELEPGDIVFFENTYKAGISHVGIYVGDGQFIHSPSSGKVVSYADLYSNYYVSHYYGAVRFTK